MKKKSVLIYQFFVFIVLFFFLSLIFSCFWLDLNFQITSFQQVLFHLRAPLGEAGDYQVYSFVLENILPPFLISLLIAFADFFYQLFILILKKLNPVFIFIQKEYLKLQFIFVFVVVVLGVYIADHYLYISGYLETKDDISTLYEDYYQNFDDSVLKDFKPQQNLVVIFAESFISSLTARANPNGVGVHPETPLGNLTPFFGDVALQNINFSQTNRVGGVVETEGTGWTAAGLVAYLCGIPLTTPFEDLSLATHFLRSAVCAPDVLHQAGYTQVFLGGSNFQFAGKKHFLENHHILVKDLSYLQNKDENAKNILKDEEIKHAWGINDKALLNFARKEFVDLNKTKKPFVLYLLTLDTHMPPNSSSCEDDVLFDKVRNYDGLKWGEYERAFNCADKTIKRFVEDISKSEFGENTAIIILGDHNPHRFQVYSHERKSPLYNVFINTLFEKKENKDLTKNRTLTHFDLTPLLLESVGISAEVFGLGRNPFKGKSLLETDFSLEGLNQEILHPNAKYNSFWTLPKENLENPR